MGKLPAFLFYPSDWLRDPELLRCSKAAKGVWIDMLCLMFDCVERGKLISNGVPWSKEEIAQAIGGDVDENLSAIAELLGKGVARVARNTEAIYCSRMVRDEHKRKLCSIAGKRGGGNPTFKGVSKGAPKGGRKGTPKGGLETETETKYLNSTELLNSNVVSGEEGSREKGSVSRQRKKPSAKHRFKDSPYYDPAALRESLDDWFPDQVNEYWNILNDASEADHSLAYHNWAAAARNWRRMREERRQKRGLVSA